MKCLSFDGMTQFYDETRTFDGNCFNSALDFLVERFPPEEYSSVFEPGIGTGRIAIPMTERGYRITGIDISRNMLTLLEKRLGRCRHNPPVSLQADMTALPFSDSAFHMVIAVHLFWFIKEWRKAVDEILRVAERDGPAVLMHTGMGAEIPFLNSRYKELCWEHGCKIEPIGVSSTSEVIDYCIDLGCHVEQIRDRWKWISHIRLDRAISYINARAYSFSTFAPDHIHAAAIEKLESECLRTFGDLATTVDVPNQIYLIVILKDNSV